MFDLLRLINNAAEIRQDLEKPLHLQKITDAMTFASPGIQGRIGFIVFGLGIYQDFQMLPNVGNYHDETPKLDMFPDPESNKGSFLGHTVIVTKTVTPDYARLLYIPHQKYGMHSFYQTKH